MMRILLTVGLAAFGAVIGFSIASAAPRGEKVEFVSPNPVSGFNNLWNGGKSDGETKIFGYLELPREGSAPFPLVIIVHTAGGINPKVEEYYAAKLRTAGYATFLIDHFTPRKIKHQMTNYAEVAKFSPNNGVIDAYSALKAMSVRDDIDGKRIGIMGASWGGLVSVWASFKEPSDFWSGGLSFAAHIPLTPFCAQQEEINVTGAPMLLLLAETDHLNARESCIAIADRMNAAGTHAEYRIYEGAFHGWEHGEENGSKTFRNRNVLDLSTCDFYLASDGRLIEKNRGKSAQTTRDLGEVYKCAKKGAKTGGRNVRKQAADDMVGFLDAHMK